MATAAPFFKKNETMCDAFALFAGVLVLPKSEMFTVSAPLPLPTPPPLPNLLYPPSLPPPRHNLCNVRLKVVAAPVSSSVDGVDDTGDGAEAAAGAVSSALGTSTST